MDLPSPLDKVVTQQTLTTLFGVVALGLGLFLSLNQGNIVVIGFMLVFTVLMVLVLVNQIRTSLYEARFRESVDGDSSDV
jgi:hypothetical protein